MKETIANLIRLLYKISDYDDLKSYESDLRKAIHILETINNLFS